MALFDDVTPVKKPKRIPLEKDQADIKESIDTVGLLAGNTTFIELVLNPGIDIIRERLTLDPMAEKYMAIKDKQERLDTIDRDITYNRAYIECVNKLIGEFIDHAQNNR